MAGRFITCSIRQLALVPADIRILGTRKEARHQSWVWVSQLAPSAELFSQLHRWKNQRLWPAKWPEYERYFKELMTEEPMKSYLERIVLRLNEGKTVAFGCYCSNVDICHRGIIADWVASQGFKVTRG